MSDEADTASTALVHWIGTHWAALAAFAWHGYVTVGRGLVLLADDGQGRVVVEYATPGLGTAAWPDELQAVLAAYTPVTEVLFLAELEGAGTLIGMRAVPPWCTPQEAGQGDGAPPLACAA